jgi:hypothetical protein
MFLSELQQHNITVIAMWLILRSLRPLVIFSVLVRIVCAHEQKPLQEGSGWASRHLAGAVGSCPLRPILASNQPIAEEHHIDNFDQGAFFTLHDFNADGHWNADEILRTYGLMDESTKDVPEHKKKEVVATIMRLMDYDNNGQISKAEWMRFNAEGGELPDFGVRCIFDPTVHMGGGRGWAVID